jgi:uncharacterized phiE125 gp8 family phage protein
MATAQRCEYWWDEGVRYSLSVNTEPTDEPLSVAELRDHARIDISDGDSWASDSITAARQLCEAFTHRRFCTTSLRLSLDAFPTWQFYLPSPKLISVTTLKYYDLNNTQQTYSSASYTVDTYSEPGRITPIYNGSWPTALNRTNAIEVIYSAGYGAANAVPSCVKRAIACTVAAWNENREGQQELPLQAKAMLRSVKWGFLP